MKKLLALMALLVSFSAIMVEGKGHVETSYRNALVLAYSPVNSVYEDENIRLEIYDGCLWANNKTDKTIFIDLAQCFLSNNGTSYPMFERARDEKKASKVGTATSIEEFLTLAPNTMSTKNSTFLCYMTNKLSGKYSTIESQTTDFTEYEKRFFEVVAELVEESLKADPESKRFVGNCSRHFTEDESINNIGATIAYSFNKRAEKWSTITITTWVCDVIFSPYYIERPSDLSKEDKKGFGIKKTKPGIIHLMGEAPFEFEEDKSPLMLFDFDGKIKKGEFTLLPIFVLKKTSFKERYNFYKRLYSGEFIDPQEVSLKTIISFDGDNAYIEWGDMKFVGNSELTRQKK